MFWLDEKKLQKRKKRIIDQTEGKKKVRDPERSPEKSEDAKTVFGGEKSLKNFESPFAGTEGE